MSNNFFEHITGRLAKTIWVILVKDDAGNLTLLADPGLNKPWSINGPNPLRNQRVAEFHAKECNGQAATYEDAFRLLLKENPNFEKQLHDRLKKSAKIVESKLFRNNKTGLIVDEHGRPVDPPTRNPKSK
jgi:hypothetical protein